MPPFASISIRVAADEVPRSGIVRMSPQIGLTKPAPTEARGWWTGAHQDEYGPSLPVALAS